MSIACVVCAVQGFYFLASGLLPFVSMRAFERITGPKSEQWLVRTVGALVFVIGSVLVLAAIRGTAPTPEIAGLAVGAAVSLALVDVNYALRGRISRIYLVDAAAEMLLILAWAAALVLTRGD